MMWRRSIRQLIETLANWGQRNPSSSAKVFELEQQLRAARALHRAHVTELESQNLTLLRELAAARLELDRHDAFGRTPSPSEMTH